MVIPCRRSTNLRMTIKQQRKLFEAFYRIIIIFILSRAYKKFYLLSTRTFYLIMVLRLRLSMKLVLVVGARSRQKYLIFYNDIYDNMNDSTKIISFCHVFKCQIRYF